MKKSICSRARAFAPALSVLSVAIAASVQAQPVESSHVIVTATRQEQRANESIASVSVIERDEIAQMGVGTLGELLSKGPGVEFSRQGSAASAETVFIRGANGGHTLVLIDGVRIGSASLGTTALEAIPLEQVQRVEVLRGPGSALYGSDAIGGVINVITQSAKNSTTPTAAASVGLGTNNTFSTHVSTARKFDGTSVSLHAGASGSAGINSLLTTSNPGYNADNDGYKNQNLGLNVAHQLDKNLQIGGGLLNSKSTSHYDGYQTDANWNRVNGHINYLRTHEVTSGNAYAKFSPTDTWDSTLRVANSVDSDEQTSSSAGAANDRYKTTQNQYTLQNDIALPVGKGLLLVERLEQKLDSNSSYSIYERTVDSYAAGWNGKLGRNSLQLNLRQDHNSQYGQKTSQYLGYGYQLSSAWSLATSYGTAFKAPTFNDLYFPVTPFVGGGNPNLKPEEAVNREVSLRFNNGSLQGHVTHFDNRIKNLIQWADDGTGAWYPANIASASIKGQELGVAAQVGSWKFKGDLTFQDPKDDVTSARLMSRAKRYSTLSSQYASVDYKLGAELRMVGSRYYDPSTPTLMAGYSLLNLYGEYKLNKDWKAFARVDNVLDRNYELAHVSSAPSAVYGVPGRTVFVGARYALK
jgi:vitamin B12 transporter